MSWLGSNLRSKIYPLRSEVLPLLLVIEYLWASVSSFVKWEENYSLEQGSPTGTGPWPVKNWAAQQEVSGGASE